MKLSPVLIFSFLPAFIQANPIAEPNASELERRQDKWCTLGSPAARLIGCYSGEATWHPWVRDIAAGERFGVRCVKTGEKVSEDARWDYIPGWNCYVPAYFTSWGCEGTSSASSIDFVLLVSVTNQEIDNVPRC
jgi:hypothetical protein